ncbi:transcription termination/antitermination protein NusG [Thermodesulforhabdus norvegica]|uniref:Transcription antitermination factor NusG n=1 Tax=Thermodesulforhabdus norvegica TaxID=39841 RepID=A0A1I4TTK4_9BACT|nr:transcription termination/antitermination NusG family protein [Thermodesulforhabdus norvegica]SFM80142.1 Transcription antitermination factor NusG [Thermodesulforhabdus norvegica]
MWYVVHTLARFEKQAIAELIDKGFDVYYPKVPEGIPPKEQPLFPRYIFIRPTVRICPAIAREVKGVIRLLGYDDGGNPLDDWTIAKIRRFVHQVKQQGGLSIPRAGDTVEIKCGVFEGLSAIFWGFKKGGQRVTVLLKLMGYSVPVELPAEAIKSPQKIKLPRRTRGKGRIIRGAYSLL